MENIFHFNPSTKMIELYYGVSLPPGCGSREEVDLRPVYTDQVEVLKVLKVYKEARFKVFRSEEEARQFSSQPLILSEALPKAIVRPDITLYGFFTSLHLATPCAGSCVNDSS
jgi:hypothetical protein